VNNSKWLPTWHDRSPKKYPLHCIISTWEYPQPARFSCVGLKHPLNWEILKFYMPILMKSPRGRDQNDAWSDKKQFSTPQLGTTGAIPPKIIRVLGDRFLTLSVCQLSSKSIGFREDKREK